jgi:hypothetical protein
VPTIVSNIAEQSGAHFQGAERKGEFFASNAMMQRAGQVRRQQDPET